MQIPWEFFPTEESEVAAVLARAVAHMDATRTPYGLIMKKDSVADHKLKTKAAAKPVAPFTVAPWTVRSPLPRAARCSPPCQASPPTDAVVATTGFTGRALYALDDRPSQLYMVGSMGCASAFGLGLAWAQPSAAGRGARRRRRGPHAPRGPRHARLRAPDNLVHVLLDNEVHDSTGGQSTVSHSVDLAASPPPAGTPRCARPHAPTRCEAIRDATELTFVHVKTAPGESGDLPRPKETPVQVIDRMRGWLKETSA
jgi:phosphonopyruvate decarboxylase